MPDGSGGRVPSRTRPAPIRTQLPPPTDRFGARGLEAAVLLLLGPSREATRGVSEGPHRHLAFERRQLVHRGSL